MAELDAPTEALTLALGPELAERLMKSLVKSDQRKMRAFIKQ
jgi:hypothetical protein